MRTCEYRFLLLPRAHLTALLWAVVGYDRAGARGLKTAVAAWHVDLNDHQPTIAGEIDGKPIRILIDTGSHRTFLLGKDAQRLDLPLRQYSDRKTYGMGGQLPTLTTLVHEFRIGSLDLKDLTLYVLNAKSEARSFRMLLGADFFSSATDCRAMLRY